MIQQMKWAFLCVAVISLLYSADRQWSSQRNRTLAGMQEVMGPLPKSPDRRPIVTVVEEVSFPALIRRKITFDSGDGDSVPAYLFLPSGERRARAAVICLHQTVAIGKKEPAGLGGKDNLHYALELAESGFVTLAPDYPRFGDYQIDPYSMGYVSATMKGIRNHRRAVDVLTSMPEVDRHRIGVIGHSLGGHNALFLAAFEPRIAAIVTSCGFTSFHKYKSGDLTGWSHRGYMPRVASVYAKSPDRMPFDFPDVLAAIAPRPIFINAPLHDANFDASGVDDCVRSAHAIYSRVFHVPERLRLVHPDCAHDFPPDVRREAYNFLAHAFGSGLSGRLVFP